MFKSAASSLSRALLGSRSVSSSSDGESIQLSKKSTGLFSGRSAQIAPATLSLEDHIANYHELKRKYDKANTGLLSTSSWIIGKKFFLQRKVGRREMRLNKAAIELADRFKQLGNIAISFNDDSRKKFAEDDTAYLVEKLNPAKDEDDGISQALPLDQIAISAWNSMQKDLDTGTFTTDSTTEKISYNNKSEETEVRSDTERTKAVTEDDLNNTKTIIGADPYMQVAIASLMNQNFCFPVNDIEQQNYVSNNSNKKYTQADLPPVALLLNLPRPTDLENNFILKLEKELATALPSKQFTLRATSVIEQEYTLENGQKFIYKRTINLTKTIQRNPDFKEKEDITDQNSPVLIECTSGDVTYNITHAPETASV